MFFLFFPLSSHAPKSRHSSIFNILCTHMCTHTCTCSSTHTYTHYIHAYMHYIYTYKHTIHTYIHIICMYIHTYMYEYTHVHSAHSDIDLNITNERKHVMLTLAAPSLSYSSFPFIVFCPTT